jgi:predicted ABC-type exoprotein transport system permease subunit
MTLTGVLLGVINIAIVIAILLLIGAIIVWFCSWMQLAVPEQVRRGFIIVVALIGLYMLVALLLGIPTIHIITSGAG